MNTLKAQTEILKAWANENTRRNVCVCAPAGEWYTIITPDQYHGYVFHTEDVVLNTDKLRAMDALRGLINGASTEGYALLEPTGIAEIHAATLVEQYAGGCVEVGINPKLLTCFDKRAQLYGLSRRSPVLVVEDDTVVGLVMPCNLNGANKS